MSNIKTFYDLINFANSQNKKIFEVCQENEAYEMETSVNNIRKKVLENINVMKSAINEGIKTNEKSSSELSGTDCYKMQCHHSKAGSLFSNVMNKAIVYALASCEQNATMGKIVACPTAGACGIIPGAIISISEELKIDEDVQINALITAGEIGRIIACKMALAGAVMGCQGECGVASGMASGAIVELLGGSNEQIINACALTLKNIMGLTCDPVAGLVEVPCVKRNAFLSVHAFTGANLSMANIKSFIPLDEVIDAMKEVGNLMSSTLKESSQGGLSTTKTALAKQAQLEKIWKNN